MKETDADGLKVLNNNVSVGEECSLRGQFHVFGTKVNHEIRKILL